MTVCIAAACNFTTMPMIITASDRMITIGDINFEPAQTKLVQLASQTVALFAGDMQLHAVVVPRVLRAMKSAEFSAPLVSEIAELYATEFAMYRRQRAEAKYLSPLGLSIESWLDRQGELSANFNSDIKYELQNASIFSEAIIAGIDQTGAHIY